MKIPNQNEYYIILPVTVFLEKYSVKNIVIIYHRVHLSVFFMELRFTESRDQDWKDKADIPLKSRINLL